MKRLGFLDHEVTESDIFLVLDMTFDSVGISKTIECRRSIDLGRAAVLRLFMAMSISKAVEFGPLG